MTGGKEGGPFGASAPPSGLGGIGGGSVGRGGIGGGPSADMSLAAQGRELD